MHRVGRAVERAVGDDRDAVLAANVNGKPRVPHLHGHAAGIRLAAIGAIQALGHANLGDFTARVTCFRQGILEEPIGRRPRLAVAPGGASSSTRRTRSPTVVPVHSPIAASKLDRVLVRERMM